MKTSLYVFLVTFFWGVSGCISDPSDIEYDPPDTGIDTGTDTDVDTDTDTSCDETRWYPDDDQDGFGDSQADPTVACVAPNGFVADNTDCDDTDPDTNPGATEVCNGLDNDCDGEPDNGLPTQMYYADTDADGFGDLNDSVEDCQKPTGYVENDGDCNDTNPDVNPDVEMEVFFDQSGQLVDHCDDGLDNDCSGNPDGNDAACIDSDGYGGPDGVDPIRTADTDGDGSHESLCINASMTMDGAPWSTADVIYQGEPFTGYSESLNTSNTVTYDAADDRWCLDFSTFGLATDDYHFRFVSTLGDDGNSVSPDCSGNQWVPINLDTYCTQFANQQNVGSWSIDPFCFRSFASDLCGNDLSWMVEVHWDDANQHLSAPN